MSASSAEFIYEHNGFRFSCAKKSGMRSTSSEDGFNSNSRKGNLSTSGLDNSPRRQALIIFFDVYESAEYEIAVCHMPLFWPIFNRSIALSA
jgi:hypothetical protein